MASGGGGGGGLARDYRDPAGAPTLSYAALLPIKDDEATNAQSKDLLRVNEQVIQVGERRFQVEEAFLEQGTNDDVIYEGMLEDEQSNMAPLTLFIKKSVSCCTLVMGSNSTRKKEIFQGDGTSKADGLIGWAANRVLELLEEEEEEEEEAGGSMCGWTLSVSFVEVADEVLVDLLNPKDKDLQILMDPQEGYQVAPLHREEVRTYEDVMRVVDRGIKKRTTKRFQDGTAAKYSSAIFEFHLVQQRRMVPTTTTQDGASRPSSSTDADIETRISRLLFVEVPCTDDLVENREKLRACYGPTLHKSLFTFTDVCKALSAKQHQQNHYCTPPPPFAQSFFTRLLQDVLGGNYLVLCLMCLSTAPGELPVSLKGMEVMADLAKASHFPNEGHEMLQGLLIKYRNEVGHANDRILLEKQAQSQGRAKGTIYRALGEEGEGEEDQGETSIQLRHEFRQMEQDVVQASLERNQAREDACKIFKVLELLKEKYNTLLEEKSKQAQGLIEVEESKLKMARSLLELKLEMSKSQEKFETEKYDMASQLLVVKNEVCELEIKLHAAEQSAQETKEVAEKAKREKEDMQVELGTLHVNFSALCKKYKEEESRTVELGGELLSLVNAQDTLAKSKTELEATVRQQGLKLKAVEEALANSQAEQEKQSMALREKTREVDELSAGKVKAELELERVKLGLEQSHLQLDKNTADIIREKELEVLQARRGVEEELRKLQALNSELEKRVIAAEGETRKENRKAGDLAIDVQRLQEEVREVKKERDSLESSLTIATTNYRQKVTAAIEKGLSQPKRSPSKAAAGGGEEPKGGMERSSSRIEAAATDMESRDRSPVEELIDTYKSREQILTNQLEDLRTKAHEVSAQNQVLFDKCRRLHHIAQDFAPTVLQQSGITLGPEDGQTQFDKEIKDQAEALGQKVAALEKELSVSQEKNVQLAELYTEAIKELEQYKVQMGKRLEDLKLANRALREQLDDSPTIKKLEEMQKALLDNLTQLQGRRNNNYSQYQALNAEGGGPSVSLPPLPVGAGQQEGRGGGGADETMMMTMGQGGSSRNLAAATARQESEQHFRLLTQRLSSMTQGSGRNLRPESVGGGPVPSPQAWAAAAPSVKPSAQGGGSGSVSLMAQVHEAEKRYAMLMSKYVMIEEESQNSKRHFKSVISKYQEELRKYRQQTV